MWLCYRGANHAALQLSWQNIPEFPAVKSALLLQLLLSKLQKRLNDLRADKAYSADVVTASRNHTVREAGSCSSESFPLLSIVQK